jgi:hypothetical protein
MEKKQDVTKQEVIYCLFSLRLLSRLTFPMHVRPHPRSIIYHTRDDAEAAKLREIWTNDVYSNGVRQPCRCPLHTELTMA